ncbi:hypothetical protein C0Q70_05914 [Pomacea canaliculata]|uniref:Uncharacterized protein n=1 Tax=Pomacea canaliculata TaxID=400727 RepID=A0A2T7PMN0_POMCA|nr:hypothetical protein C0Q70_05914 [Pomacea canaliculata]
MIEVHGLDAGNVTDDCACDPNATQPTSNPNELNQTTNAIVPQVQTATGTKIAWRRSSSVLKVELVPLMRSYETYSCEDVKERAYRSHAACYTNPFKDSRTICEMPSVDFWHVFWIIRSAFISSYSEALFGLLKTWGQESLTLKSVRSSSSQARAIGYVSLQATTSASDSKVNLAHRRSRRQTPSNQWEGETDNQTTYHLLASELADELAKQLGWNVSGVEWFAYGLPVDVNVTRAVVFLADKRAFGLDSPSLSASPNMTELVQQVAHAIQNGELRVTLEGQQARLQSLEACGDIDCRAPYLKVNAAPTPVDGHSGELGSPSSSVLFVLLAAVVKSLVV